MAASHEKVEKSAMVLGLLTALAISFGGLAQIVPLYFSSAATQPAPGIAPYAPLELEGRDVYVREGCYNCHSQMVRPLRAETERYGHYSLAGESVYDRPFQFGSKRTGPDLSRVGGRYSDEWHRIHLLRPRDVVPESNMPGYPWLESRPIDSSLTVRKMLALRTLGTPYTQEEIDGAADAVADKTEMDALIAYLQGRGRASRTWTSSP
ncbi:MAG TPA: cytochrome-c oxidase, cbb3-type subunit II [Steroidobacteraceae bacterium]|nr:cytochrome-c oxidase, cbb3-type subunit II [Steroidobacteraceae bacterium]